jgi:hypothetical protein
MSIVLKDKIKVDKNFINDLIVKSWEDSESIQNQIGSIEADSASATKVVKLLKDLLISYYVFIGCLENLENEPTNIVEPTKIIEPEVVVPEKLIVIPEEPVENSIPDIDIFSELDTEEADSEPFEYFVDFDEPTGEPLTDDDLYN